MNENAEISACKKAPESQSEKNGRGPWSSLSSPSRIRISCGQCTVSTLDTSCPQFLQMARALMVWQNRLPQGWDTGILVNWDQESKKCNEYAMTQIQGTQEIPRKPKKSQESFAAVLFSPFIQVCRWRCRAFEAVLHMSPPSVDAYSAAAKAGPGFWKFSGASRNWPPVQTIFFWMCVGSESKKSPNVTLNVTNTHQCIMILIYFYISSIVNSLNSCSKTTVGQLRMLGPKMSSFISSPWLPWLPFRCTSHLLSWIPPDCRVVGL